MIKKFFRGCLKVVLVCFLLFSAGIFAEGVVTTKSAVAVFAGGCFWCMEEPFDELPGVISTTSGYTGGKTENPTYKDISNGKTGHSEAVQVTYDPTKISYAALLEVFWHNIDPFDEGGQFCDKGDQYKAAIFYQDEKEKQLAEASKLALKAKLPNETVVTSIRPAGKFFPAEDYHQDYYLNNPRRYQFYRFTCGRDQRLHEVWGGQ